jgi:phosphatidylserine/phosphatidylglycerophosphate/cardiolipin synthase-like enzyme
MLLLRQPGDGVSPLLSQIHQARVSVDTTIFRLDLPEVDQALRAAASRGARVRALVAHTNRGGEDELRALERRLAAHGVAVARTGDDLVRYHAKMLIVDGAVLHLMLFNYTHADIAESRSFGLVTGDQALVQEAIRLFEADITRHAYVPRLDRLVVSPLNARQVLADLIRGSRSELLVYDPRLTDAGMRRLLRQRAEQGVDVRVLGHLDESAPGLEVRALAGLRLHARVIVSDGRRAFLGSQSLRRIELEGRREVGAIVDDLSVVREVKAVFEADWSASTPRRDPKPMRAWQPAAGY